MCRLFFIFNHHLTKTELTRILAQRTRIRKNTPFLKNPRDDGPHKDGFGMAYQEGEKWISYKSLKNPISKLYDDFKDISKSKLVILHFRHSCHLGESCTIATGRTSIENSHPFLYENYVFAHNGNINDFEKKYRTKLRKYISDDLFSNIKGETDSEWIFYMCLTLLQKKKMNSLRNIKTLHSLLKTLLDILKKECEEFTANFIFSNGEISIITRYIHYDPSKYEEKQEPNSLYYDSTNGFVISSEPITQHYTLVPENTAIYVDHSKNRAFLQSL